MYSQYDKILLAGDFNCEITDEHISDFINDHALTSQIKDDTCFKSVENPSCINLFLTNNAQSFQNSTVICSGLSDCHNMVLTVLKTGITKRKPHVVYYRDYKNFKEKTSQLK